MPGTAPVDPEVVKQAVSRSVAWRATAGPAGSPCSSRDRSAALASFGPDDGPLPEPFPVALPDRPRFPAGQPCLEKDLEVLSCRDRSGGVLLRVWRGHRATKPSAETPDLRPPEACAGGHGPADTPQALRSAPSLCNGLRWRPTRLLRCPARGTSTPAPPSS